MAKTKVIEIDSLEKYIRYLNKYDNCSFYRGESKNFPSRESSAFRKYKLKWSSAEPYPFIKMIDEFYKETAYKLGDDKIDFIAFAQHHGIPTNLLDISTSPLIALYFACQADEKNDKQNDEEVDGVVYLCVNEYIDITNLIHQYPNQNLIEAIFSNTPNKLAQLVPLFTQYKKEYPDSFSFLLKNLIKSYLSYFNSSLDEQEQRFNNKLKRKKFDLWECLAYLVDAFKEIKEFPLESCDEEVYFYIALQFVFFKNVITFKEPIPSIDFLPNMIYRPIMKFERGRNQQGLFLYQGYLDYIEPVYNFRVLAKQQLFFKNIEFHIKNKTRILKELDRIGINKKTVYCDYDNIAKYIVNKYDESKIKGERSI